MDYPKLTNVLFLFPHFDHLSIYANTPHYNAGKFRSNLLNPLTLNDFTLHDSFEAVEAIKMIPNELFSAGYV